MNIGLYLKRVLRYIFRGVPVTHVVANVKELGINNMLAGRVAMITGGSSGIGYAIAKSFLKSGAEVIITGRNVDKLREAKCRLIQESGSDKIVYMVMDNANVDAFDEKFTEACNLMSGKEIDILVNNAGLLGGEVKDVSPNEYDLILNTNLRAVLFLSRKFATYWKGKNIKGNILNIASSSSLRPAASAYTISKWGLRGLTMGLAKSFIPYGIVVNGLAPGPTATPMIQVEPSREISWEPSPIGRLIMPEEIAGMAVVLVSEMGRAVVGDIVYMTGGCGLLTLDDVKYDF